MPPALFQIVDVVAPLLFLFAFRNPNQTWPNFLLRRPHPPLQIVVQPHPGFSAPPPRPHPPRHDDDSDKHGPHHRLRLCLAACLRPPSPDVAPAALTLRPSAAHPPPPPPLEAPLPLRAPPDGRAALASICPASLRRYGMHFSPSSFIQAPLSALLEYSGILPPDPGGGPHQAGARAGGGELPIQIVRHGEAGTSSEMGRTGSWRRRGTRRGRTPPSRRRLQATWRAGGSPRRHIRGTTYNRWRGGWSRYCPSPCCCWSSSSGSTCKVNLDFSSEQDMIRKFRAGLALQPMVIFANSPFKEGKPNGFLSLRSHFWTDTENNRSGMLECQCSADANAHLVACPKKKLSEDT
ncbi:uncharacterized protein LOC133930100 [Phragmites australis]|uniref:uncharacterized protein LOC133930100 n=1 Tax=Phragmites australis TaxID=29695 RepID=UPI002D7A0C17|nr:uncharacterized protein LOC133930100 [Phragmites australis]